MNTTIKRFTKGTWVEKWPNKVNLDDKDEIYKKLMTLARLEYPGDSAKQREKRRYDWMYEYVHQLGNDAFLEIGQDSYRGWVVFNTEEEVIKFILTHS
jgi:hypothetical protein